MRRTRKDIELAVPPFCFGHVYLALLVAEKGEANATFYRDRFACNNNE